MKRLVFEGTVCDDFAREFYLFCLENVNAVKKFKFAAGENKILAVISIDSMEEDAYRELIQRISEFDVTRMEIEEANVNEDTDSLQPDIKVDLLEEALRAAKGETEDKSNIIPIKEKDYQKTLAEKIWNYINRELCPSENMALTEVESDFLALVYTDPFFWEMSKEEFTEHVEESDRYDKVTGALSKRTSYTALRLKIEKLLKARIGRPFNTTFEDFMKEMKIAFGRPQ